MRLMTFVSCAADEKTQRELHRVTRNEVYQDVSEQTSARWEDR